MHTENTSVLIVGGGLVGLSMGLFLQYHGADFILVEQNSQASSLPRARGIHARTMELFRQIGLEESVKVAAETAWTIGGFGGARRGTNMLASEALPHVGVQALTNTVASPSCFCACPQTQLETVLHQPLSDRGGDIRFGHRLVSCTQGPTGGVATVEAFHGTQSQIKYDFLVAADGGRSTVRRQLGINVEETPPDKHYVNIFFRANLKDKMNGRTFSQCEIQNAHCRGLLISKDNATEWSFHLEYDPKQTDPRSYNHADYARFVRSALGDDRQPVEIIATAMWSTVVRVAQRYRSGRTFLVGDAAHVMPPWGGLNGNTGIADAHNLAWKLAAATRGSSSEELLESYEWERRPVAVRNGRQARLRSDFDARFDLPTSANAATFQELLDIGALLMRHRYVSSSSHSQDLASDPVSALTGQIGTRFPHVWIGHQGKRKSILDLFGRGYVAILGTNCKKEDELEVSLLRGTKTEVYQLGKDFQICDGEPTWTALTGLSDTGALVIRPDGFVAVRKTITEEPPPHANA